MQKTKHIQPPTTNHQPTNKRYTIYEGVSPKILKPTQIFKKAISNLNLRTNYTFRLDPLGPAVHSDIFNQVTLPFVVLFVSQHFLDTIKTLLLNFIRVSLLKESHSPSESNSFNNKWTPVLKEPLFEQ